MAAQLRLFVLSLLLACSGGTSAVPEVVERPVTPPLDEPDTVRALGLLAKGALATAKVPASSIEAPPKSATFQCGRVGGQPLEEFEPLLGDRLRIQRVSGSRQEPAAWNVMGAPEPLETETRLFYDVGEEKFVMMSYELFRLAGEDFVEAARRDATDTFPATRLERTPFVLEGLEALQLVPTSYDASSEAVFVYGLYVVRSDRTVQVVTFYVNPHLASHGSECTKLAMRSAGTLRTGPKSFDRSAHSWTLTIDGQRHVEVAMPVDTSVVTQQGPDFFVHRIHQWVRFGGSGAGGIMYFGGHPSSSVPDDAKITAGTLLGLKAEWGSYVKDSRTLVEALVPLGDHFFAHAVLNGPEGANLSLLRNALGAAQLP